MQRIIGYECFLENTITILCENLGLKRKLLGINTNFITEAMKDKKPGKMKSGFTLLSCQPRVTVTSCFVYKVIRDLESIDHLCINPFHRIGLIHK